VPSKEHRPLDFLRDNFDWTDYVETHYEVKYSGEELRVNCPNPECDDRKYKFYVNPGKRQYYCFKCKASSRRDPTPITFVCWTEGLTKMQAIIQLLNELEETTADQAEWEEQVQARMQDEGDPARPNTLRTISRLPEVCVPIVDTATHGPFLEYLLGRGLTLQEIFDVGKVHCVPQETHLLYDPDTRELKGDIGRRIVWPVYGSGGNLVSWVSRDIEGVHEIKYLNAPNSDLSKTFWPFCKPFGDTVVLVEGILDAYAVRRIPETSAYACFTKYVSDAQKALLKGWEVKNVVLAWDKKDAKPEMIAAVEDLKTHFNVFVASQHNLPKHEDCGDTLRKADGVPILEEALTPIDVYSIEYEKWKVT
jgi:DNA primase